MKKKIIAIVAMFIVLFDSNLYAQKAQEYFYNRKVEELDKDAVMRVIANGKKRLELIHQEEKNIEEVLKLLRSLIESSLNGDKIKEESKLILLRKVFENYKLSANLPEKSSQKLEKKICKGVVLRELYDEIKSEIDQEENAYHELRREWNKLNNDIISLDFSMKELCRDVAKPQYYEQQVAMIDKINSGSYDIIKEAPVNKIEVDMMTPYQEVNGAMAPNINSWFWLNINDSEKWSSLSNELQTKGWEWANKTYNLRTVEKSYPIWVKYYVSTDYPEYAVKGNCIYTTEGQLVRVIRCLSSAEAEKNGLYTLYREDYEANKYNIKSKPAKTQDYLKANLGIASKALSEEKKNTVNFLSGMDKAGKAELRMRLAKTKAEYNKAKRDYQKSSDAMMDALDGLFFGIIDDEGSRFMDQLNKDHQNYASNGAYFCGRVDNVSFLLKYLSFETQEIFSYLVTFVQSEPFETKEEIKLVSRDKLNIKLADFIQKK